MEQDLVAVFEKKLIPARFKARFIYSPQQVRWFYETIKEHAIRPKETMHHSRNKLLIFFHKLHCSLAGSQMADAYEIGIATAFSHVSDVVRAILKSYKQSEAISFPSMEERRLMEQILKRKGDKMPSAIFAVDGSHLRCTGRNVAERRSFKYSWYVTLSFSLCLAHTHTHCICSRRLPCFGVHVICERIFGTVVAFNIDKAASKHDLTALRDSWFYNTLDEIMNDWLCLCDKGYTGSQNELKCMAVALKKGKKSMRHLFSKKYWKDFNTCRNSVEHLFAHVFSNKFTQLGHWPGKSRETFIEFCANVICSIIVYNVLKKNDHLFQ